MVNSAVEKLTGFTTSRLDQLESLIQAMKLQNNVMIDAYEKEEYVKAKRQLKAIIANTLSTGELQKSLYDILQELQFESGHLNSNVDFTKSLLEDQEMIRENLKKSKTYQ
jgi:hypothetical protein